MRRVQRYVCDVCGREFPWPSTAEHCEETCRKLREDMAARKKEEEHWHSQGHDTWVENGKLRHAPAVDPKTHGDHHYPGSGTRDCFYGCGCWAGPARSSGPVDPFGPCPNNPKGG